MEKQERNGKQLWTNPMQCLNLEDNLNISQTHSPHGVSEWKGCSLGINNQMGGKQRRQILGLLIFFFFKWQRLRPESLELTGILNLRVINTTMAVCPWPFLFFPFIFNLLRLVSSSHFAPVVLLNVRACLMHVRHKGLCTSELMGRRWEPSYHVSVFRALRKWFETNKVRKAPSDI